MLLLPPKRAALTALLTLAAAGCGDPPPAGNGGTPPATVPDSAAAPVPVRSYERSVTFVSTTGDSLFTVPWVVEATTMAGGVARTARAWLGRGGQWQPFLRAAWTTPPSREPWRIVPRGPLRILVGPGDRLDRILHDGGSRQVEVALEETVVEWTGNRGGSFHVREGGMTLGDRRVPGWVLDVSQGIRAQEGTLGDWLFLTSGDSLAMVVQAPIQTRESEEDVAYQGWAWFEGREYQWSRVDVAWAGLRSFEPARRDIPDSLSFATPDGLLDGSARVRDILLEVRDGPGPVLPVDGIMEVAGSLVLNERRVEVHGILRHRQP